MRTCARGSRRPRVRRGRPLGRVDASSGELAADSTRSCCRSTPGRRGHGREQSHRTRPDVAAIALSAHEVGALTYVDGVHATPHDLSGRGACRDFYRDQCLQVVRSHVGAVIASPGLLETLHPDKLAPAPESDPCRSNEGRFRSRIGRCRRGSGAPGLTRPAATGSRRERILTSMTAIEEYETALFESLVAGWKRSRASSPTGRLLTRADHLLQHLGTEPHDVAEELARRRVNVWSGDTMPGSSPVCSASATAGGGARRCRALQRPVDVDRLLEAVTESPPPSASRSLPSRELSRARRPPAAARPRSWNELSVFEKGDDSVAPELCEHLTTGAAR